MDVVGETGGVADAEDRPGVSIAVDGSMEESANVHLLEADSDAASTKPRC